MTFISHSSDKMQRNPQRIQRLFFVSDNDVLPRKRLFLQDSAELLLSWMQRCGAPNRGKVIGWIIDSMINYFGTILSMV